MSIPTNDIFDLGRRLQAKYPTHIVMLLIRHKGLKHTELKMKYYETLGEAVAEIRKEPGTPIIKDNNMEVIYHTPGTRTGDYTTIMFFDKGKFEVVKRLYAVKQHLVQHPEEKDFFTNLWSDLFGAGQRPKGNMLPQIPPEDVIPSPRVRPGDKMPPPPPPIVGNERGPIAAPARFSPGFERGPGPRPPVGSERGGRGNMAMIPAIGGERGPRPPVGGERGPVGRPPVGNERGGCRLSSSPRSLAMTPLPQAGELYQSEFERGCGCGGGARPAGPRGSPMGTRRV